jgi:hypothetical protein
MSKLVQQLVDNAYTLTEAYIRTHDASLLDVIKGLLSAAKEELAAQPSIFPALPALPVRHPDSLLPQVTAYAAPDVNFPWSGIGTTSTTITVGTDSTTSDKVVVTYGDPSDLDT